MIDDTLLEAEEKMDKAVSVAREDFATIRTGRATPAMFNKIVVDYYGTPTPVTQMASFQVPDARMVVITPYDKGSLTGDREGDPRLRPRREPDQRRPRHPGRLPAADRGAPHGVHQGRAAQGRGRQDRHPQHPPARQGRRSTSCRRTATRARTTSAARRRSSRTSPTGTSQPSTSCSSTRKPSCSRSDSGLPPAGSDTMDDSTATAAGASDPHGRAGRNLWSAIGVGLLLGVVLTLVPLLLAPSLFAVVVAVAMLVALYELEQVFATRGITLVRWPLAVGAPAIVLLAYYVGATAMLTAFAVTVLVALAVRLVGPTQGYFADVAASAFALSYTALIGGFVSLILDCPYGAQRVITFVVLTVCSDVGGYAAGVLAGRHPMAPTHLAEEVVGGFRRLDAAACVGRVRCASCAAGRPRGGRGWCSVWRSPSPRRWATSWSPRSSAISGVKDMGTLLPGHGGADGPAGLPAAQCLRLLGTVHLVPRPVARRGTPQPQMFRCRGARSPTRCLSSAAKNSCHSMISARPDVSSASAPCGCCRNTRTYPTRGSVSCGTPTTCCVRTVHGSAVSFASPLVVIRSPVTDMARCVTTRSGPLRTAKVTTSPGRTPELAGRSSTASPGASAGTIDAVRTT